MEKLPEELDENFKELSLAINDNAKEKGFWESMIKVIGKMESYHEVDIGGAVRANKIFSDDQIKAVKKAFVSQKLMLVVSELGEATESHRKDIYADWDLFEEYMEDGQGFEFAFENSIKDSFEDEIADTVIRLIDLAEEMNIDLMKHIKYKMEYNSGREKMHGGKDY